MTGLQQISTSCRFSIANILLRFRLRRSIGSFLTLLVLLRRARISGIKGVRISGTDSYESENAEATTDNAIKTVLDLRQTIAITEGTLSELVKGLPG